jgi:hypothetical protein
VTPRRPAIGWCAGWQGFGDAALRMMERNLGAQIATGRHRMKG